MKIYWIKAQAPRRVLALVKHLGLDAELIDATKMAGGLKSPDYARMNPNCKAPTLVDGDFTLWESSAIMTYLCIKAGSDMWPAQAPQEQIEVLRWQAWNDCHWAPAVEPFYFELVVKSTFRIGEPDRASLTSKVAELDRYARVLDAHLRDRDYVACGRLTVADFQLASMATHWREAEMPLQDYSGIVRWIGRLQQMPAWADPWPSVEATAARSAVVRPN